MNGGTQDVLKLPAVLDLGAAEGFLVTIRQRAKRATMRLDASEVETLTLACIQIILAAAIKRSRIVCVDRLSEEFASAFADLGA